MAATNHHMLPSYEYNDLDHSIKETRLAEILPGTFDDDIQIRIHCVALNKSDGFWPKQSSFTVGDLQKDLPNDWTVRETINGRFIFERHKEYGAYEPYETSWVHPRAKFEPVANNYNLIHTKPEYEALSHVWGPVDDRVLVYVKSPAGPREESVAVLGQQSSVLLGMKRPATDDSILPVLKRNGSICMSRSSTMADGEETPKTASRNGQTEISTLLIQAELATALRHLRFKNRSRMMWIDNICINQADTSERSHLVRHMGQIYRLAAKVIVWLGAEHDNSKLAMQKLDYLGRQVEITNKGSWRVNAPSCLEPTWSRTSVLLPWDHTTWDAIASLLRRPWFKRLWVWQEAKLANDDSIIQCGYHKMELYRFGAAAWCAAAKSTLNLAGLQSSLFLAGDAVLRQFDEPFLNTLLHLNGKDCSDPRDKIYGALGLAPAQLADQIIPDYSKEIEEVYTDTAIAICNTTGRVDFLLACNLAERTLLGPTWTPDWSVMQQRSPRWLLSTTLASGVSMSTAEVKYTPKPTLLVQGVEWGTICCVGARAPLESEGLEAFDSVLRSWAPTGISDEFYVTKRESLMEAFVKTVHWNTLRERCPLDIGLLTLAEAKTDIAQVLAGSGSSKTADAEAKFAQGSYKIRGKEARGRCYIELDNGYIGLTSAAAEETDIVCVILGCPLPMVLRPHSSGRYQVVGPTYIHGLMDAESLLGPLAPGLVVQVGASAGWYGGSKVRNLATNELLDEDPRLGDVPPAWIRTEAVRVPTDPLHFVRFRDLATGNTINGDPRLRPDELRARGVPLKPLKLV